jgi:hypothetical protein
MLPQICKHCRWFQDYPKRYYGETAHRRCTRILPIVDDEAQAHIRRGDTYTSLWVVPEFGCNLWEASGG